MNVFHALAEYNGNQPTVVTLGTFDGVHLGHKCIFQKLIKSSANLNCQSLVLTFFPHPRMVLKKDDSIKLINTIEEKTNQMQALGIDHLIIHPFDAAFANLEAEEFVKTILVDRFKMKKIIIGYDHRFGKGGQADINDLIAFGKKYNFEVEQIVAQELDEVSISSTQIRNALAQGDVSKANAYLGYEYYFNGIVTQGKQLGRTIGFPTANIQLEETYKLIPKVGVYIVSVLVDGQNFKGMMNIGTNPTVGDNALTQEVHILDFDRDIYNQKITVVLHDKIREQVKFDSLEHLKLQLAQDRQTTINYFSVHHTS